MLAQHIYHVKVNIGSVINIIDTRGFAEFKINSIYYKQ